MTVDLLFPFQHEGVTLLAQRQRFGLHDEMGLGKSAQAIRAIDMIGGKRGIVIAPAKLRRNWASEFRKWSLTHRDPRTLAVANDQYGIIRWLRSQHPMTLMISYELATKFGRQIYESGEPLDYVVLDEGHYIKNAMAKRTRAILGNHLDSMNCVLSFAEYAWHLSGTPMANDPLDIYTFLRMCNATDLNETLFTRRYFYSEVNAYGSRQTIRPEMLPELTYVIEQNRIRRTKKQVGIQLPPIFMSSALVDGDDRPILDMIRQYPGMEDAVLAAVEAGSLANIESPWMMELRRLIGEAKAVPYAHILADEVKIDGEKVIVFGHHVRALAYVQAILARQNIHSVLIDGSVTDRQAKARVDEFQDNPQCKVFIGNMRAAGLGNTLTAAAKVDILESDWTPAGNAQAIMRAHRIGQHRNVYARFITLDNSLDIRINNIVAHKTKAIADIEGEPMNAMVDIAT